jgi:hypothetical protein
MISCYQFKASLTSYIDQEISFQKRKAFEEHLANCPVCKNLYSSVLATRTSLQSLPKVTVSEQFFNKLQTRILAERNARIQERLGRVFSFRRIPSFAYGFAAALLTIIVVFSFFEFRSGTKIPVNPPQIVHEKLRQNRNMPNSALVANPPQVINAQSPQDSSVRPDEEQQFDKPDFQNNIKTVKQER